MRYVIWLVSMGAAVIITGLVLSLFNPVETQPSFVPTFSAPQATYLGLDPEVTFNAILRELKPQQVRLQTNWNDLEPEPGKISFAAMDKYVAAAKHAGVTITLAIGRKLPRWPECHDPAWLGELPAWEVEPHIFSMLRAVVTHYRTEAAIVRWQLENEPLFAYGNCPPPNWHRLVKERDLVRQLDPTRPILITDTGELSSWWETAGLADEQGTTMYRVTWNPFFHYFSYPLPPAWYSLKAALIAPWVARTVVSELQLEPWAPHGMRDLPLAEAQRSMDIQRFRDNVAFFRGTGLPEAFLWGVEWWYFAKENLGEPAYWNEGKLLLQPGTAP